LSVLLVALAAVGAAAVSLWAYQEHREDKLHFHSVTAHRLYRSAQPTPQALRLGLPRRGITMVINLRSAGEDAETFAREQQACRDLGVRLVNIPVTAALPSDEQIEQFLRAVRASSGAALVHCQMGRSRTAMMVAAWRIVVEDVSPQQAREEMIRRGFRPGDPIHASLPDLLRRLSEDRNAWLARTAANCS
jgi:uncharacterized protein (TIGR01244 family)